MEAKNWYIHNDLLNADVTVNGKSQFIQIKIDDYKDNCIISDKKKFKISEANIDKYFINRKKIFYEYLSQIKPSTEIVIVAKDENNDFM